VPSTARIERTHSYRARSVSKEGTWPLQPPPFLFRANCTTTSGTAPLTFIGWFSAEKDSQ
jgi:hypothetical protein